MVRDNMPMAMQGLAVVPIYAGYDLRRRVGRIFKYDITGGRYEETDFHATGSGGRDARTTIKLGYRKGSTGPPPSSWRSSGLFQAADEDSATGGPSRPGHLSDRRHHHRRGFERVQDAEVADRFQALIARMTEGQRK